MWLQFNVTGHFDKQGSGTIILIHPSVVWRVKPKREILMSKLFQTTRTAIVVSASVALIALMTAAPIAPANAQGVPAGLLRLDPPQGSNQAALAQLDTSHAKIRATHARSRKIQAHQG